MRWTVFCTPIAATPAKPVTSAAGTSLSANGLSVTASAKNATSSATFADNSSGTGRPLPPGKPIGGDDNEHELEQCQQLGDGAMCAEHQRCAERDEIACYVSSRATRKSRTPAVSTKPPVEFGRAASPWFRITASSGPARPPEPPFRSLQGWGRCHAPRRRPR
jgi:hypothetical protein